MKFRKPPVVEVWISVEFESNENKKEWEIGLVQQYLRGCQEEFPKLDRLDEQTIQVEKTSPTDLPTVVSKGVRLKSVRLWNAAGTRVIQLGDDSFSFHVLKSENDIPGYTEVRLAAEPKLEEYVRIFQPTRIRSATLHYLDIIDIPMPASGAVNLRDYFPQAVDLPEEPFGLIAALDQQFHVICPADEGPLFFRLQSLSSPPEERVVRFQMEWHKQSLEVNTLELSRVWSRMDIAHEYMRKCFQAALSDDTLKLFDPILDEVGN